MLISQKYQGIDVLADARGHDHTLHRPKRKMRQKHLYLHLYYREHFTG